MLFTPIMSVLSTIFIYIMLYILIYLYFSAIIITALFLTFQIIMRKYDPNTAKFEVLNLFCSFKKAFIQEIFVFILFFFPDCITNIMLLYKMITSWQ